MTRLRFIKRWSMYFPGDIMETESAETVKKMVEVYGLAEIVGEAKAIIEPPRDKMVRKAKGRKSL